MLNKKVMRFQSVVLLAIGLLFTVTGWAGPLGALAFLMAGLLLISLAACVTDARPAKDLPRLRSPVRDLFDDHAAVNELKAAMGEDEDFDRAVHYVYNLPPKQFLAFSRLIVEARYSADQSVLATLARQFNREQ